MRIENLVEECINDLDNNRLAVSTILLKATRIAYRLKKYKDLYWMKIDITGTIDRETSISIQGEVIELAKKNGLYSNDFVKDLNYENNMLIQRRKAEYYDYTLEEEVSGNLVHSIAELEKEIESNRLRLDRNVIPNGLANIDAYYNSKKKDVLDNILIDQIDRNKKVIERTKKYLYEFLLKISEEIDFNYGDTEMENVLSSNKNVFIIHGHDEAKWRELKTLIKDDFNLQPFILQELPDRGKTIIEKFEYYAEQCTYAFAIFTPDDVVENNGKTYFQARPNVIFELGWFAAKIGRQRVCILLKEGSNMEVFSDFNGVIQKRFYSSVSELYRDISIELESVEMI